MKFCKTLNGIIHTTANGLEIYFKDGKYYLRDKYLNEAYLCKWNQRQKLFDFYGKSEVQFMNYREFVDAFNLAFGRKKVNWV